MKRQRDRPKPLPPAEALVDAARELARSTGQLRFSPPVACVYNPLQYAWAPHELYLRKFGASRKQVLFLGMNPGPFGMVQTGIPFGHVAAVRDWLKISAPVLAPNGLHPARPILGFDCPRSEVSGERLWGLFAREFPDAHAFFERHFVLNYCPLAFVEESGRNRTPDKLPPAERSALFRLCDAHLARVVELLDPEWVIGIGNFAYRQLEWIEGRQHGKIPHPSPASPAANRDWAGIACAELVRLGIW